MSSHDKIIGRIKELREILERQGHKQDLLQNELCHLKEQMLSPPDKCQLTNADNAHVLTTGPVIRCGRVQNLYVEILNNSENPQTVRILLFDLRQLPKQSIDHRIATLNVNCAISECFDIGPEGQDLLKFEVQVEVLSGISKGIHVFVAGTSDNGCTLVHSNVFRHEQLSSVED